MAKRKSDHPTTDYAKKVVAGKIPAGELLKFACQRHIDDLKHGKKRSGIYFDEAAADHAINFFGFLKHSKGEWAGRVFELEPWQIFIVGSLFGWMRSDGLRRFRTAYNEVPRKNGKSTLAPGIALYLMLADGEEGAEVYSVATKKDQAKIVWTEGKRMVQSSEDLREFVDVFSNNISVEDTNSKFEPLGADENTLDGLNPHGVISDELHAHKTRGVVDVMETATGARREPLTFEITTAGYNRHSICYEHHEYSKKVLQGIVVDDSWFAFICSIDKDDDWTDPAVWAKANPNYNVSVKPDDLARTCDKAKQMPAAQNAFKRLRLNVWTEQADRWLDMSLWDSCKGRVYPDLLKGETCYGGLDLASREDIAALALFFPEICALICRFWVPEETVNRRSKNSDIPYDLWVKKGHLKATEGDVIDFDVIRNDIKELYENYNIEELAYDRWNATQLTTQLEGDGLTMVPFGQGFASMSAPTKSLSAYVRSKELCHGGNPVLRWMASNVAVRQDPAGNLKPDKSKSNEKIDGIVASVMAIGRAELHGTNRSIYEDRGLLIL
jgi:phage terminase large subunit-like protein